MTLDLTELAARESAQVEWKDQVADIDDVVATLCAFANDIGNLGGGYVVCGAREGKDNAGFAELQRAGLDANRLQTVLGKVLARCLQRVSPPLVPLVEELPAADPTRRLLIFLMPASALVHTFRRDTDTGKHYVRVGSQTREARNGLLLALLTRKGAIVPWDRRACAEATAADIDLLALRDTLTQIDQYDSARGVDYYLSDEPRLGPFVPPLCTREPLTGALRPRNFTVLLFGRDPQRFVPGAVALASRYDGTDRAVPTGTRHDLAGTLLSQARKLVELLALETKTQYNKTSLTLPHFQAYPPRALHEAAINALVHRDYELVDPLRLTVFADRIEIVSPGGLPVGVSLAELRAAKAPSRWRNQALAWFFLKLKLAQAEGQGVATMRRAMRAHGCPPPRFTANPVQVRCELRALVIQPRSDGL